jgi:hypothetical protein
MKNLIVVFCDTFSFPVLRDSFLIECILQDRFLHFAELFLSVSALCMYEVYQCRFLLLLYKQPQTA